MYEYTYEAAGPFTPRNGREVTCHELWYRYIPESGNWYDGTFTRWKAALSAATATLLLGLLVYALNSGDLGGVKVEAVTSTGNTGNGISVNDDTDGTFVVDLGGGVLGSIGNNRVYNNASQEIRVDLDGGELKAENNWWGDATGLQPGETTLDGASTIDADPYLSSAP